MFWEDFVGKRLRSIRFVLMQKHDRLVGSQQQRRVYHQSYLFHVMISIVSVCWVCSCGLFASQYEANVVKLSASVVRVEREV